MQFVISATLQKTLIPMDYRRKILSFFKSILTAYEGGEHLPLFYDGTTARNGLCFAVSLPRYEIAAEHRFKLATNEIKIFLSLTDRLKAVCLMNAVIVNTGKIINAGEIEFTVRKIRTLPETEIALPYACFKLFSPLCLRRHDKNSNKDSYVTAADADFAEELKENLRRNLAEEYAALVPLVDTLNIDSSGLHRSVIRHYDALIPCSIGKIVLAGDKKLLQAVSDIHLGSRRSAGFGFVRQMI